MVDVALRTRDRKQGSVSVSWQSKSNVNAKLWSACSLLPLSFSRACSRKGLSGNTIPRQQAGWAQSGSKLHALQSSAGINNLSAGGGTSVPD